MFKLLHGNNREFRSKISLCPSLDESAHELHLIYGPSKPLPFQQPFLGGDPAAGSPTATLLRLLPPRGA